jgi:hypothetical protein
VVAPHSLMLSCDSLSSLEKVISLLWWSFRLFLKRISARPNHLLGESGRIIRRASGVPRPLSRVVHFAQLTGDLLAASDALARPWSGLTFRVFRALLRADLFRVFIQILLELLHFSLIAVSYWHGLWPVETRSMVCCTSSRSSLRIIVLDLVWPNRGDDSRRGIVVHLGRGWSI